MRKVSFCDGEIYHIYNRGVEKRNIFTDQADLKRFIDSVNLFNDIELAGSFYEQSLLTKRGKIKKPEKLVEIICFALNPNHFHFLLKQTKEKGIEKFMHRLGVGYSLYFNKRHKRSGHLFQGVFKSKHVDSNEYLLDLSVYVNLNDKIHRLDSEISQLSLTSWLQFIEIKAKKQPIKICNEIIIEQFKNTKEYKEFAEDKLPDFWENKDLKKELEILEAE
ncbi:MAG: transposase [Candidatus Vogelbacteria bacterium]|nr:transposase [Candidatus Vogelbacteria bacterium]